MTIGYNARAYRLLEAIHDLAGGDPRTAVLSAKVSARTCSRLSSARHAKRLGWRSRSAGHRV
jgi:hypothetical protein